MTVERFQEVRDLFQGAIMAYKAWEKKSPQPVNEDVEIMDAFRTATTAQERKEYKKNSQCPRGLGCVPE
jgi:hypothetical protein